VTNGKPDPEGYLLSTQLVSDKIKRRLEPADCLVIEDAPLVAKSVRTVGFPVLGVATSHAIDKFEDASWRVPSLDPDEVQKVLPGLRMTR
jgi:beta-phosphoglucomutase-like phosphatase (HAD superfamily)